MLQLIGKLGLFLVVFCAMSEILSLALFAPLTGTRFNYAEVRSKRLARISDLHKKHQKEPAGNCKGGIVYHPFLGYAPTKQGNANAEFFAAGAAGIGERSFVIGILGGSVAYRFSQSPDLVRVLKSNEILRNRDIVLIPLGFEGYKYPQQLNALILALLNKMHFDFVISLDGLNEASMGVANARNGVSYLMPEYGMMARLREMRGTKLSWWTLQVLYRLRLLSKRELRILESVEVFPFRYSISAGLTGQVLAASYERHARALEDQWGQHASRSSETREQPSAAAPIDDNTEEGIAQYWAMCIRLVHAICTEQGIPYVAFIQPSLYMPETKLLTVTERGFVPEEDARVTKALQRIREAAVTCGKNGIPVRDLTDVFRNTPSAVYLDFCHLNNLGQSIVAQQIARELIMRLPGEDSHVSAGTQTNGETKAVQ